jgi:hypothetical protein
LNRELELDAWGGFSQMFERQIAHSGG